MRRRYRVVLIAGMVAAMPVLAGCADFDMDSLDIFHLNEKKKLPGERREVFPGGVPGVTQGIPPEYMKGNQQQADTTLTPDVPPQEGANPPPAAKTAAIAPAEEPKPKAKPKPKPRVAKPAPTRVTVQPAAQAQGSGEQKLEPWPATAPAGQQQPPAAAQSNDPWLSAPPPPGTMSR